MQQLKLPFGMAMLEALVALVVLAFGVLGLLWMHQQALLQQRQQLCLGEALPSDGRVRRTFKRVMALRNREGVMP
jgi:Tfp pilus assembly protein PilV